ncbi:hypothetical protein [Nocardioides terrisoli]|uniref:hypothetical protein n=1 Tax=Nocardioides terrisoli TaxID=3388267 RepID=UPI00287BB62A|nr:hypothetical protein [Nocardioides marmorisolisilvae]
MEEVGRRVRRAEEGEGEEEEEEEEEGMGRWVKKKWRERKKAGEGVGGDEYLSPEVPANRPATEGENRLTMRPDDVSHRPRGDSSASSRQARGSRKRT